MTSDHRFDPLASRDQVLAHITQDPLAQQKLDAYVALLTEWRRRINLIGEAELPRLWQRHILDSAQLLQPIVAHLKTSPKNSKAQPPQEKNHSVLDIGSGGGLPAMVLAILAPQVQFILVESDSRKCRFLETATRACDLNCKVINTRMESLPAMQPPPAVITARATASLTQLLQWTRPHHHPRLMCLFMKGGRVKKELDAIAALTKQQNYSTIQITLLPSITHPEGCIVQCTEFNAPSISTSAKGTQAHG